MSDSNQSEVLTLASRRIGIDRRILLDALTEWGCENLPWYLRSKIIDAADDEEMRDNERVLKYAYNFCRAQAQVTLLKEQASGRTPDLLVKPRGGSPAFYVEVRHFRLNAEPSQHPVSKIVDAISSKRVQLPDSEIGFVAIDNFAIHLEAALSHSNVKEALCEVERTTAENPGAWEKPSGVIFSACTPGMDISNPNDIPFPHIVWINRHGQPAAPSELGPWLASCLPDGVLFDSEAECSTF